MSVMHDIAMLRESGDDKDRQFANELEQLMSPPGALGLPKLLEERRWEHGITDGFFRWQPVFDRLYVFQVPARNSLTYIPGGKIVMTDQARSREQFECPQGIIVGAGLLALDQLRSNGIDLGHRVMFIRNAPYRVEVDMCGGKRIYALPLVAGDLVASFDAAAEMRTRKQRVRYNDEARQHELIDGDGKVWHPLDGWKQGDVG
jgi:hypothetical protein